MYLKNKTNQIINFSFISIFLLSFSFCTEKQEKKTSTPKVEISDSLIKHMNLGSARITRVRGELKLTGKVMADQSKQIEVYPLVGGTVKTINVELGDYVEKDQVLGVIKSGEAAEYQKQLNDAKSNYEVAKKNMQVAEDMFASKLMSEREYLAAKQELKKSEGELYKTQELQKIYNINSQSEYFVKAPISGFITEKKINKDMQIRPDNTGSIFVVSQLTNVWVIANVYETDIDKVKEKDTVGITTIVYPDKVYKATIDKVYSVLDPQTRVMKIRIALNNPDYLLKPEMYANVVVNYLEPESMVTISSNAIVFDNSNNYVLIYNGGKDFKVQKIDLYKTIGNKSYVKNGIKPGDKIVTSNQLLIYNALTNN